MLQPTRHTTAVNYLGHSSHLMPRLSWKVAADAYRR